MDYVTWGCQRYRNESNMKVKGNIITARAYTHIDGKMKDHKQCDAS